jgi:FKBP-type peptidyl-prolyl cis-trans isomerase 2
MRKVKQGDHITIEYQGMLEDGEIIESSANTGAFELEVGKGFMPPGFENALIDMEQGQERTITLPPEEAFGHRDKKLLHTLNISVLGENATPKVGMILGMTVVIEGQKQKIPALVTAVNGEEVSIDFNHPLAGKAVVYKFTVKGIKD